MSATHVEVKKTLGWLVEARCLDESDQWKFEDEAQALWFRDVAKEWFRARCPKCGYKDIVQLTLDSSESWCEVIATCGYFDCEFSKRIVYAAGSSLVSSHESLDEDIHSGEVSVGNGVVPPLLPCACCKQPSKFTILLATDGDESPRYYIPNQHVRSTVESGLFNPVNEVPFCGACMREIEDCLRETIDRLQGE